ncbi:exopolysaccharide biosynthesis polyprenyl glycosylphosphotransferase [Ancylobacter sp. VNQ12]|uniref:exopolysaccharide biosynthesis polyprenyl glycosylphosphotransferase n=1 Tax=Ancylobacter sp. VNQ12 TaxID=3400920 RepID=UPI003BFDB659
MTRWTHGLINRLVILCDLLMITIASVIAYVIWHELGWSEILVLGIIGAATYVGVLALGQAYRVEHYTRWRRQIAHLLIGSVPAAVAVCLVHYALTPVESGDLRALGTWGGMALLALLIGRFVLVRLGMAWVTRNGVLKRDAVVIGDLDRAYELIRRYERQTHGFHLLTFVGVFRAEGREASEAERNGAFGPPVLGGVDDLLEYAKLDSVDVVIITKRWADIRELGDIIRQLHRVATDVVVELEPDVFEPNYARLMTLADLPALQVQQRPLKGSLGLLKAIEDYTVAGLALLLLSPVLLLAALAIKLDSPGPVMFRQARVGLNNRQFMVYKLRTMHYDPVDDGSIAAVPQDPRITRVGAILRSFSIDEIPQLINVLRGEMSVVGPRPHVPNMLIKPDLRYEAISDYVARYRMKPGITGWAQINGMRGGIYTVEKAERGVDLDLYYIEHWSIWFDIRILLLTVTKGLVDNSAF